MRAYVQKREWLSPTGEKKIAWRARYEAPGRDGGLILRSETFTTKKAAEKRLRHVQVDLDERRYTPDSPLTVGELLAMWQEARADHVTDSTRRTYRETLARLPARFLARRLRDLTPLDIQAAADTIRATGLSPHSIRSTMSPLRAALRQAVRWRMIAVSPYDGILLPTPSQRAGTTLTPAEVRRFLAHPAGGGHPDWGLLWRTMLATGIRSGELRALHWGDLDRDRCLLHIQRTVQVGLDHRPVIGAVAKSASSRRVVPITPELADALLARRRETMLIFPGTRGGILTQGKLREALDAACAETGIPRITPHDFRRTWVVLLRMGGVDAEIVSALAGHSSIVMTLDVYSRSDETRERAAMDALDAILGRPGPLELAG